jgi:predicted DNA-binding transcriptional regulator YafY
VARNRQIIRTLTIVRELSVARRSLNSLAEEFGTNARTIRRDLEALEAAGFPLVQDEQRRWRVFDWRKELA